MGPLVVVFSFLTCTENGGDTGGRRNKTHNFIGVVQILRESLRPRDSVDAAGDPVRE